MAGAQSGGLFESWYTSRIGEPTTTDEIYGYWLYFLGVVAGILGVVVFFSTEAATMPRAVSYALLGGALVLLILGAVIRLPLKKAGMSLGVLGAILCVIAIVWGLSIYPEGWSRTVGDTGVILTYAAGLLLLGIAGAFVPLLTDPIRQEHEDLQREQAESAERDAEQDAKIAALEAEIAELEASQARFELYADKSEQYRWRLRHRNGNIIADSGEGYTARHNAQKGIQSVRRNAFGAGLLELDKEEPEDADKPDVAVPGAEDPPESQATFELIEDDAGEWRWRLVHDNGNIIADSGEGYANKSNAKRALSRIRDHVGNAEYLEIDPAAYELYRAAGGEWRWRLVHENGNILADSGEGYSSRRAARSGMESVRNNIAEAEVIEQ